MTKVKTTTVRWKDEEDAKLFLSSQNEMGKESYAGSDDEMYHDDDDRAHDSLLSDINKITQKKRMGAAPRSVRVSLREGRTSVDTQDIIKLIGVESLKKTTDKLQRPKLAKPVEKVVAQRAKRATGYQNVSKELNKWGNVVHNRRMKEQLTFPLREPEIRVHESIMKEEIKMNTPLEETVYSLLQGAKLIEDVKETNEELARKRAMSLEELKERNRLAWKLKRERIREQRKSWRQNKNKSRKFHRLLRRDRLKKQKAEIEELERTDPEAALERLEQLEKARVEERMTLRHKTSKWAHLQGARALRDEKAMAALKENKSIHQELLTKRKEESASEDEEENIEEKLEILKKERKEAIEAGLFDPSNPWTANLFHQEEQKSQATPGSAIDESFVNFKKFWDEVNKRRLIEKQAREKLAEKERNEEMNKSDDEDCGLKDVEDDSESERHNGKDENVETIESEMKGLDNDASEQLKSLKGKKKKQKLQTKDGNSEDIENKEDVDEKDNNNCVKKKSKKQKKQKQQENAGTKIDQNHNVGEEDEHVDSEQQSKGKKKKNVDKKNKQKQNVTVVDVEGVKIEDENNVDNMEIADTPSNKRKRKGKKEGQQKKKKQENTDGKDEQEETATEDLEEHLISIDSMFSEAELKLQKKLKQKLKKLGIDNDKGWTKVKSKKEKAKDTEKSILPKIEEFDFTVTKSQENMDEGLERAKTMEDMDSLQNKNTTEDSLQKAVTTLMKGDKETSAEPKKKTSGSSAQIDPSKFLEVDAKMLQSAMPDTVSQGDEGLDDDDSDDEAEDIIHEAFKDDYLVGEFRSEKDAAITKDNPAPLSLAIPGWGDWTGPNIKLSKRKLKRYTLKQPPAPPRKDATLGNVIYNEKADVHDNLRKAMVSELPYPFSRVKDFEASVRSSIGRQFVPEKEHRKLTVPPLKTKLGTVIEPMTEDELLRYKPISDKKDKKRLMARLKQPGTKKGKKNNKNKLQNSESLAKN